jgi:2-polyprenyl-6-methoxyphenol hydroxylase-like FAD-dependent oxidoreductase
MRVAVVGAGIAGLAAAVAVAQFRNAETVVYERHLGVRPGIGLAVNLAPNGMRVLDQLGLAHRAIEQGRVLRTWEMGHTNGEIITRFPLRFEEQYGQPMVAIRRELLIDILHNAAVEAGVDLRFGREVTGIEERSGGVGIGFADDTTEHTDVVAACDGAHSRIKAQLFGGRPAILTGQGHSFGISRPGDQLALMKDTFITRLGAGNYFGGYDIGHGEVLWFVGYDIGGRVRTLGESRDLTADYSLQVIKQLTSEWGRPVPRVIDGTNRFGARAVEHQPPPKTLTMGRVVLLGDAGHPVQLFFGQGANLALEDATTLAHLVGEVCRTQGGLADRVELALAEYDRIRLPRRVAVADYSRRMGRRYHWTNPVKRQVRTLYLQALGTRLLDSADWIYGHDKPTAARNHPSST